MTDTIFVLATIGIAIVAAAILIALAAYLAFAAWCRLTARLGRWLAARQPIALTEQEIRDAGRPHCEPIPILPIYTPNGSAHLEDVK